MLCPGSDGGGSGARERVQQEYHANLNFYGYLLRDMTHFGLDSESVCVVI
jgi:hypothetical protein